MRVLTLLLLCACSGAGKSGDANDPVDTDVTTSDTGDAPPPLFDALVRFGPGGEDATWMAFGACGPRLRTARPAGQLDQGVRQPGTHALWGVSNRGSGTLWVSRDATTPLELVLTGGDARAIGLAWDPNDGQLVSQIDRNLSTFVPDDGPWIGASNASSDMGSGGTLSYDPSSGGFVGFDRTLNLFDAALTPGDRVQTTHELSYQWRVELVAGGGQLWALESGGVVPGELSFFEQTRRLYRVDAAGGRFEPEGCASYDPPAELYMNGEVPGSTGSAPAGEVLLAVNGSVRRSSVCGPAVEDRTVPNDVFAIAEDPQTGQRFVADWHDVYSLPPEGEPVEMGVGVVPELSWPTGLAWSDADHALYVSTLGGEGYLYRWTAAEGWTLITSLWNHDVRAMAWRPDDDRLYVLEGLGQNARMIVYNRRGAIVAMRSVPRAVLDDRTVLRAMDGVLVAFHPNGARFRIDPQTGETDTIECP